MVKPKLISLEAVCTHDISVRSMLSRVRNHERWLPILGRTLGFTISHPVIISLLLKPAGESTVGVESPATFFRVSTRQQELLPLLSRD